MDKMQEKIDVAIQDGLFGDAPYNLDDIQVFDSYGNYCFPTDFSNSEGNTIVSILQIKNLLAHKN